MSNSSCPLHGVGRTTGATAARRCAVDEVGAMRAWSRACADPLLLLQCAAGVTVGKEGIAGQLAQLLALPPLAAVWLRIVR